MTSAALASAVPLVVGSDGQRYGDDRDRSRPHRTFRDWVLARDDYDLSKFVFLGLVPPPTLAHVLSASDAHIYLTVPFVLGWSMMDALACGRWSSVRTPSRFAR